MRSPERLFVVLASVLGLAYAALTPPCYVPDEVAHFWRAVSIAHGTLNPTEGKAPLPKGYQVFVFCVMHRDIAGKPELKIEREWLRTAWTIDQKPKEIVALTVTNASYTPWNYLPHIAAALIGRITGARPMIVFYLGRVFSLAAFLALVAFAIRVTPYLKWGFCAAGLLPMTLFMAASWSADPMTIGMAFIVTALSLRGARDVASPITAFVLGLCKPIYFLLAAISRRWLVPVAALAGFIVLILLARGSAAAPSSQWTCVSGDPMRFARVVVHDFAVSTPAYLEQMVGRLGQLDVILPKAVIWLEWLLLAALIVTAGERVARAQRLLAFAASVALIFAVSIWMYLTWTKTCGDVILGVQGRYYLPLLPAFLVALSNPWWRWRRVGALLVGVVAAVANVAALVALVVRYY